MSIDKNIDNFCDLMELKAYADAQYQKILELSQKIKDKDYEIQHLKELLDGSVPTIKNKLKVGNDEEEICKRELHKLNTASKKRELTTEEAKKCEIYTKLLISLGKKKPDEKDVGLSDEELMKLVETG